MTEYVELIVYCVALILVEIAAGLFVVRFVLRMPDEREDGDGN